ncbi:hypothetical protein KFL_004290065 [Klebsormidium nitens]|uniref:Citrate transporter-like domain-containing protein n=1 Tax=Klebsormidium nitens TaxID=105231 RepID=A0A1Y1IC12_KLENI|nr:hypothetical protein KFL_004290065 [Klebsormidium nitens]|eukprot:GAQ88450.1 hypothetical protein KFL_004290065 [Klebsormidium nitens]
METSGVAQAIADVFTDISDAIGGKAAAFVAIYITTAFLSEIVSNNAAGALMYPIAARLGDALGVVPSRMTIVVMLGASAGFTLPYSYQTNLMVFAAGDYRFLEFAKFGLPCQLFMIVSVIIIFALEDTIWASISIAVALFAAILAGPLLWVVLPESTKDRLRFWGPKVKAQYVRAPELTNGKIVD